VLNRSAARQYFGTASPVGKVIDWYFDEQMAQPMTVVGIVEDVRQESPTDEVVPEVFLEYRQYLGLLQRWGEESQLQDEEVIGFLSFSLRTAGDPARTTPVVRQIVNEVDPSIGIDAIVPMSALVASSIATQRFNAVLLAVFAGVAGLLGAIGVYGVLAYSVTQRTQEIGIRMALGAQGTQVLASVVRTGLILTMIGIGLGLGGAAVGARLLEGMLFGVTPLDATTFVAVSLLFGFVSTFASWLPAHRAMNVNPIVALRCD
jgi:putative ABC transport system permease protein